VQTKSNEVLSDVLRAYGSTHDMDAVSVVLSFVNSDRAQVREAARDALGMYGQDAIWKLREAYVNLIGKPAPDDWNAARVAKELFTAYDRFRLQDVYALMDEGLAKAKDGKLEEAVAAFDKVLARQPLIDRRAEMVPVYVMFAQSIEEKDRATALAYLRKGARLDPEGPRAPQIESEILYLEGKALEERGIADSDLFKRAIAIDAGNARARAELDRLEADADTRHERIRRWAAAGAVIAAAIAGLILFAGRRRTTPALAP
jgi:tetratricopeptide (TPR) repeat protein